RARRCGRPRSVHESPSLLLLSCEGHVSKRGALPSDDGARGQACCLLPVSMRSIVVYHRDMVRSLSPSIPSTAQYAQYISILEEYDSFWLASARSHLPMSDALGDP